MNDQGKAQLVKLLNRIAGENMLDPHIEARFMLSEVDGRTAMLKKLALKHEINPEIVDNFDLAGIEAESFAEFLSRALEKANPSFPTPLEGLPRQSKEF